MKLIFSSLSILLVLGGCATYETPAPKRLEFEPVDKSKYKTEEARENALNIARAKCRAYGMQVAAGSPPPLMPQRPQVNVNVQTAPNYGAGQQQFAQPHQLDVNSLIAAEQAGAAMRFRDDLMISAAVACMAEEGWLTKDDIQ